MGIIVIFLYNILSPIILADDGPETGFKCGVSFESVVPVNKVTLVNYDEETYLDDYSYLASIPTAVFHDDNTLYSHPLLFYQKDQKIRDEKEITLNANEGIEYFMDDWEQYCKVFDEITTINIPFESIDHRKSRNYTEITEDNPYDIAKTIALHDWSYSDKAVISVISEDYKKNEEKIVENEISDVFPVGDIYKLPTINIEQTNSLNPMIEKFNVGEKYKHMLAEVWWDGLLIPGAPIIPAGDPDIQLYYQEGDKWVEAAISCYWNLFKPKGYEISNAHVYKSGSWQVGITDFPTESSIPRKTIGPLTIQGSLLAALRGKVVYHLDIAMYPGTDVKIPDLPPYGCRDVDFKLKWHDRDVQLGFSIIGPSGESIITAMEESKTNYQEIHLESLGECLPGEYYSISVFALKDVKAPVDFEIEYSWGQGITESEGDSLTSATEGAILASLLNAPLLYTSPSELAESTEDVLYKLGVEEIYVVDIGAQMSKDAKEGINDISKSTYYYELREIYDAIREISGSNDVVFTTIDPWTYWLLGELKPAGEKEGALFIGPAAYIAAHHGTPAIIIDNHPRLSSAVVWHNEFWRRIAGDRYMNKPSTAEMVLTGRRIYDFLGEYGFDKDGYETIVTVADQYDIGVSWDRIFPGVANAGRICGTPVDTSYWIARNVFYPALIYSNPALNGPVALINGSESTRKFGVEIGSIGGLITKNDPLINLNIGVLEKVKGSEEGEFSYPVLCSFVTHKYRFNERASKYYGAVYECPTGQIPGVSTSFEEIDMGSIAFHTNKEGAYYPDMSETEVVPFYLEKGGYDVAYSTSLEAVVDDLNRGVIIWFHASHGSEPGGGGTLFWSPDEGFEKNAETSAVAKVINLQRKLIKLFGSFSYYFGSSPAVYGEKNPWRGYDWYLGSTDEPDTMSIDLYGYLPYTAIKVPFLPPLGIDWVSARKPIREFLNDLIPFINPFEVNDLYDGVTGTIGHSKFSLRHYSSTDIDENLGNLHSAGFITSICQTSNTYFHTMLIRHGSVFQVQDPWPTSWYGTVWKQSIPRDLALGYTAGEAYTRGISQVGILYLGGGGPSGDEPQWWWDDCQSVVYFGDPNLRIYVPGTDYSSKNNWEKPSSLEYKKGLEINGHTPFGATSYPNEKAPETPQYLMILGILLLAIIIATAVMYAGRRKK